MRETREEVCNTTWNVELIGNDKIGCDKPAKAERYEQRLCEMNVALSDRDQ